MRERLRLMVLKRDHDAIERARSDLSEQDVQDLVSLYPTLETWDQRLGLLDLIQDQWAPEMEPVLLDVLRAPGEGDSVDLPKASALGILYEEHDTFMRFYNDRPLLHRVVEEVLAAHGLEIDGAGPEVAPDRGFGEGESPLFRAVMNDRAEEALALIASGADVNERREVAEQSVLGWAAFRGHVNVVEALLAGGATVDAQDRWGSTPLHNAASNGHLQAARRLLRAGADVSVPYYDGRTILMAAIRGGNAALVAALLDHGADPHARQPNFTPLGFAVAEGTPAIVEVLLNRGVDPNVAMKGGATPLMLAAQRGRPHQIGRLLEAGADPSVVNGLGLTAWDMARGRRAPEVRRILDAADQR